MAYFQNWNSDDKLSREALSKELAKIAPMITDKAFYIDFQNDDGGTHCLIYAEMNEDDTSSFNAISTDFLYNEDFRGWRIMRVTVPPNYIEAFLKKENE